MQKYVKIYFKANGYDTGDNYFPSEISGESSVDIHHINAKGSGGDPQGKKDRIENLIGLTRVEHLELGDKKQWKSFLFRKHKEFMLKKGVKFNEEYIDELIDRYSHYG